MPDFKLLDQIKLKGLMTEYQGFDCDEITVSQIARMSRDDVTFEISWYELAIYNTRPALSENAANYARLTDETL